MRNCFNETLRIEPPVSISTLQTFTQDVEIDGVKLHKGEAVFINMEAIHHNLDQWKEPARWVPDRFDPTSPWFKKPDGKPRHPMAFGPFLGGQRICLGKSLAELMARFTIPLMMWHYEFSHVDQKQKENKPLMNISGMKDCQILMHKKKRNALVN